MKRKWTERFFCLLAVMFFAGCAQMEMKKLTKKLPWAKEEEEDPQQQPVHIVAIWNQMTMNRSGKLIRGFGGRIIFFGQQGKKSVEVDGKFMVYAYDEDSPKNATEAPRKFVFTKEHVLARVSDSKFGPAYSFWLPFDEVGGEEKKVTLIPYFAPTEGVPIHGESTTHTLAGKKKSSTPQNQPRLQEGQLIKQVSYQQPEGQQPQQPLGRLRMKTTTINLAPRSGLPYPRAVVRPQTKTAWKTITPGGSAKSVGRLVPNRERLESGTSSLMVESDLSQTSLSARSAPSTRQAQAKPTSVRSRGRGSWQQYRGGWQSSQPSQPVPAGR